MRILTRTAQFRPVLTRSIISNPIIFPTSNLLSTKSSGDDEWNDAWETAWLPDDLAGKEAVAPWESDVNFGVLSPASSVMSPAEADAETKAFVEDMNENWEERRKKKGLLEKKTKGETKNEGERDLYSLENMRKDYRLKKQRIHAALWVKEIEKLEESRLGTDGVGGGGDDIDKLLDSCSEFFDPPSPNNDSARIPSSMEFRNKPDGWETTSRDHQDGSVWDMTQREEDILVQEFERRMAFCKHQIASFVKTHIFSRRRPIDGWKYMIEEIGPNAKKGKGSVSRLPSLSDPATQPFKEEADSFSIDSSSGNHHRSVRGGGR